MNDKKKPAGGSRSNSKKQPKSDPAVSYDEFKEFEGRKYTGAKVGRHQKWYYDQGEWKERKITPDLWQFTYAVNKRRAGRAPPGSGVPVGTEYHWYILAHQNVHKLNANDYTTSMTGLKFKVAHKRADREKWSATEKTQRKRMIAFLEDVIRDLETEPPLETGEAGEEVTAAEPAKAAAPAAAPKKAAAKRAAPKRAAAAEASAANARRKSTKAAAKPKRPRPKAKSVKREERGYAS